VRSIPLDVSAYFALLILVGLERLLELRISKKNQRALNRQGVEKVSEPNFLAMVVMHTAVLFSAAAEVYFLRRPLIPALAVAAGGIFLFATGLRWWVIRTMAGHWNVQVMASVKIGVVSSGPYEFIRHPNYVAVILELASLPLIHTAWITAIWATAANAWVLSSRLGAEDAMLMSNSEYREAMGAKPRFIPRFF
jgi:methyltransferase